jgi:hypothetical protein
MNDAKQMTTYDRFLFSLSFFQMTYYIFLYHLGDQYCKRIHESGHDNAAGSHIVFHAVKQEEKSQVWKNAKA